MKRSRFSAGMVATTVFATAIVAAAVLGGIASASSTPPGTLTYFDCVGPGGCTSTATPMDDPRGVAIEHDLSRVFVAAHGSDAVDILIRNPKHGELSQKEGDFGCVSETGNGGACGDGRALVGPTGIAVANADLYLVSPTLGSIVQVSQLPSKRWAVPSDLNGCTSEDGTGGACVDGHGLTGATSVTIQPKVGGYVYVGGTNSIAFFSRNKNTGALTQIGCINDAGSDTCINGNIPGTVTDMVIPEGSKTLYATASGAPGALLTFTFQSGILTETGCFSDDGSNGCTDSTSPLSDPVSLDVDGKGKSLYVAANGSDTLTGFKRDPKTGLLSSPPLPPFCYNETGTGGCNTVKGIANPRSVRLCHNNACVLATAGDGIASFNRSDKTGALTQPGLPFVPCFNATGTGGCTLANGLHGATAVDSTFGSHRTAYVTGATDDTLTIFSLK